MTFYQTIGTWNSKGLPDYLNKDLDINPKLIERIIETLPEKNPVPSFNPQYLNDGIPRNILIEYDEQYQLKALVDSTLSFNFIFSSSSTGQIKSYQNLPTIIIESQVIKNITVENFSENADFNAYDFTFSWSNGQLQITPNQVEYILDGVVNTYSMTPTLTNITNAQIEIKTTFITEGAGYRNSFGYYVYPLRDGYKVPTKIVNNNVIPLNSDETDLLNKVIVFPNTSFLPQGDMKPGHTVKLLYNPNDPSEPFPNNVGVGFFLVSNGWNGSDVKTRADIVYSNKELNVNGLEQMLLFNNIQATNDQEGELILGIEDILRPGGDKDFNDLVIRINYSPTFVYNLDDLLLVSNGTDVVESSVKADSTGLYLQLNDQDLSELASLPDDNLQFIQNITFEEAEDVSFYKEIFDELELEHNAIIENVGDNRIQITYNVPKSRILSYIYFVRAYKNKTQQSVNDPEVNNIVLYQDHYVFDKTRIQADTLSFNNTELNARPDTRGMATPLSMGDPHITTIYGDKYMLPMDTRVYELYNNDHVKMYIKLDHYNNSEMTFMRYLILMSKNKHIIVDMFEPLQYYQYKNGQLIKINSSNLIHLVNHSEYTPEIHKNGAFITYGLWHIPYILNYYNFESVTFGLLYVPALQDYINSISIIPTTQMTIGGKGLLISDSAYNIYKNIDDLF